MNYLIFLTIVILFLLIVSVLYGVRSRKKNIILNKHQSLLDEKLQSVSENYRRLQSDYKRDRSFTEDLLEVKEKTSTLQMTLSTYLATVQNASIPERYQYIRSASEHCTDAGELAKLFSISCQEAEQLAHLSQLGNRCKTNK